ncbi:MAG TPA: hypothetical protein VF728_00830, partial [Nocardioides sp.]
MGALLVGVVWAGAALALLVGGSAPAVPLGEAADALTRLPAHLREPAAAWPSPVSELLPGPYVYWACTGVVTVLVGAVVTVAVRHLPWGRVGSERRRPLGVDARPRFASRRELGPVLVRRATAGRFTLARFGRQLVATEARQPSRRPSRRAGDRGAVALIGPSRSGKTTAAV